MRPQCFSCFRPAKYRVGEKRAACHFHLQLAVTQLLAERDTVPVTYL